jgi:hypothetical protein
MSDDLSDSDRMHLLSKRLKDMADSQTMAHGSAIVLAGGASEKARQVDRRATGLENRLKVLEARIDGVERGLRELFSQMQLLAKRLVKATSKGKRETDVERG